MSADLTVLSGINGYINNASRGKGSASSRRTLLKSKTSTGNSPSHEPKANSVLNAESCPALKIPSDETCTQNKFEQSSDQHIDTNHATPHIHDQTPVLNNPCFSTSPIIDSEDSKKAAQCSEDSSLSPTFGVSCPPNQPCVLTNPENSVSKSVADVNQCIDLLPKLLDDLKTPLLLSLPLQTVHGSSAPLNQCVSAPICQYLFLPPSLFGLKGQGKARLSQKEHNTDSNVLSGRLSSANKPNSNAPSDRISSANKSNIKINKKKLNKSDKKNNKNKSKKKKGKNRNNLTSENTNHVSSCGSKSPRCKYLQDALINQVSMSGTDSAISETEDYLSLLRKIPNGLSFSKSGSLCNQKRKDYSLKPLFSPDEVRSKCEVRSTLVTPCITNDEY